MKKEEKILTEHEMLEQDKNLIKIKFAQKKFKKGDEDDVLYEIK